MRWKGVGIGYQINAKKYIFYVFKAIEVCSVMSLYALVWFDVVLYMRYIPGLWPVFLQKSLTRTHVTLRMRRKLSMPSD